MPRRTPLPRARRAPSLPALLLLAMVAPFATGSAQKPAPPTRPPAEAEPYIVLYDQPVYRGHRTTIRRTSADLSRLRRETQSVTIGRGTWQLCDGREFTGRCVTLGKSAPRLTDLGIGAHVMSARPVRRERR